MGSPIDGAVLRQRQDMLLANHYITLHVTVVGLALGVAAVVASSLLAGPPPTEFKEHQPVLSVLWLASLLGVAVVYGGPMVGAIMLPARVPAVVDFLLPMLLAVCEFTLFTVLAYRITGWTTPKAILAAWWLTYAVFALAGLLQLTRAHHLIRIGIQTPEIRVIVVGHLERLRRNMAGAAAATVVCAGVGVYYLTVAEPRIVLDYMLAIIAMLIPVLALAAHRRTAKELRDAVEQLRD